MSEQPICSLFLPASVPGCLIDELILSLTQASITVQNPTQRGTGLEDVALVLGVVVGSLNLAEYGIKIAKSIIKWRQEAKLHGVEIKGRLEHPDKAPLDLEAASDTEVEEWLSR